MTNHLPARPATDLSTLCAEPTRRVQHLTGQFWHGDMSLWRYRKLSRELTQQFVNEVAALLTR